MRGTEIIRLDAKVVSVIADAVFRAELDNGHQMVVYAPRENREKVLGLGPGGRVKVELSPYDMSRGQVAL